MVMTALIMATMGKTRDGRHTVVLVTVPSVSDGMICSAADDSAVLRARGDVDASARAPCSRGRKRIANKVWSCELGGTTVTIAATAHVIVLLKCHPVTPTSRQL